MSVIVKSVENKELQDYLENGYAMCTQCGATMERKKAQRDEAEMFVCPACGWSTEGKKLGDE